MTIYVVVFSSSPKRFQTLNSKNVKWKVQDVPPPRENDLSQQKLDPESFQTNGSLIIIIIIEHNTVHVYCTDINYGIFWTTRQPYAYMQQWHDF